MTTTVQRGTPTIALAPNVPIQMQVKWVDVWANDPTKNDGKGYGASLSLKGIVDGETVKLYPKGKLWAVLKALKAGGVIDPAGQYDEEPAEKYSIPVQTADVTLVLEQLAGQRYPEFRAVPVNGRPTAPQTAKPVSGGAPKEAHSIGGPLPWETEEPAATPTPVGAAASGDAWETMRQRYLDCVDVAIVACKAINAADIPVDGAAVSSMAATLFIRRSERGV